MIFHGFWIFKDFLDQEQREILGCIGKTVQFHWFFKELREKDSQDSYQLLVLLS